MPLNTLQKSSVKSRFANLREHILLKKSDSAKNSHLDFSGDGGGRLSAPGCPGMWRLWATRQG